MKNKFLAAFAGSCLLLLVSCGSEKISEAATEKKDSLECILPPTVNPNGDSELALLMREMVSTTQAIHDSLQQKKAPPVFPEHFGRIFFAKKTDSTLNADLFNGLANGYIQNLKHFYNSSPDKKLETYNGMVNACISCHENFCHGPIKRIQKFLIPVGKK